MSPPPVAPPPPRWTTEPAGARSRAAFSLADLSVWALLEDSFTDKEATQAAQRDCPRLRAIGAKVTAMEGVQAWLQRRPPTRGALGPDSTGQSARTKGPMSAPMPARFDFSPQNQTRFLVPSRGGISPFALTKPRTPTARSDPMVLPLQTHPQGPPGPNHHVRRPPVRIDVHTPTPSAPTRAPKGSLLLLLLLHGCRCLSMPRDRSLAATDAIGRWGSEVFTCWNIRLGRVNSQCNFCC